MDYPGKVITKNQVTPTQISATGVWTLDDAAAATRNNNWPVAGVPNPISKSLRFNSADTAYLSRTLSSSGNRKTWTWSGWIKGMGSGDAIFGAAGSGGGQGALYFTSSSLTLREYAVETGSETFSVISTAKYRDPSAWYHIVAVFDTTQATASNRIKLYVNGVQITSFSTSSYPSLNFDAYNINNSSKRALIGTENYSGSTTMNGYQTEINFIDGQALTPSSFGMTDPVTGVWEPLKYSGTYGTNGFYLNFKDATSTTTLGLDYSGNANNWTTNNFSVTAGAGNDSLTDVPTPWIVYNTTGDVGGVVRGNYCTLNPLGTSNGTLSDGNLRVATNGTTINARGTIALPATGKWYFEFEDVTHLIYDMGFGISNVVTSISSMANANGWWLDVSTTSTYIYSNSTLMNGGSAVFTTGGAGVAGGSGSKWGIAVDIDSGKWWARNSNGWQTISGNTGDPAAGTNPISSDLTGTLFPVIWMNSNSTGGAEVAVINFGQRPFAYTPPSGFLSLCTTNLPASTVLKGGEYMNAVLWTGTGTTGGNTLAVTGVGFQPDLVWYKNRTVAVNNYLNDVIRGSGAGTSLHSNTTSSESSASAYAVNGGLASFNSDGFTAYRGTDNTFQASNLNGNAYVAWNWKANGAGVTNTAGTITSSVSASTTSGFSIVTWAGNSTNAATIGHGLGVAPSILITKSRTNASSWVVGIGGMSGFGINDYLVLQSTAAKGTSSTFYQAYGSSTFTVGVSAADEMNKTGNNYVTYCFAPISGFSAFGSYTGNGSADGPFVYLGFRPRFVMGKASSGTNASTSSWFMMDSARNTYNVANLRLFADLSNADNTQDILDFTSNGFKLRTTNTNENTSGTTYIYMAFAENPFKNALAR